MLPDYYYTIERSASAEFKDRGSKFIAYAFPVAGVVDFKKQLQALKEEHPKAAHHCLLTGSEPTEILFEAMTMASLLAVRANRYWDKLIVNN